MKTRAIKFLIPAMAIVFAIAASAFTSIERPMDGEKLLMDGYLPNPNVTQPCDKVEDLDCQASGTYACTIDGDTYFRIKDGTSCHTEVRRNNP